MLHIVLNGETKSLESCLSIAELLMQLGINNRYCAVEQNEQLVPRERHAETMLQDGDRVEVVTLVGGG